MSQQRRRELGELWLDCICLYNLYISLFLLLLLLLWYYCFYRDSFQYIFVIQAQLFFCGLSLPYDFGGVKSLEPDVASP